MTVPAILLLVLDLEALAAFVWAFLSPSETGHAVLLWLSLGRSVLAFGLLLVAGILSVLLALTVRNRTAAIQSLQSIEAWLVRSTSLIPFLTAALLFSALLALGVFTVLRTPLDYPAYKTLAPNTFPLIHSTVLALLPLLLLLIVASVELVVFLAVRQRRALASTPLWTPANLAPGLLVVLMVLATLFQWITLVFQLRFFVNIPAWYWIFIPVAFGWGDLAFALLATGLLLAAFVWLVTSRRSAGLVLVVVLSLFLQFGVGLMGGNGLVTLRDRFFTTYHRAYVEKASQSHVGILDGIRRYEELYGSDTFTGTKAPGLMAFYSALERLVNGDPSPYDDTSRYARFSTAVIFAFPVLAAAVAPLLYGFVRHFLEDPSGLVQQTAPLLYVLTPNVVLFTFFADQALYPLGFLLLVSIVVVVIRRQAILLSFALGLLLYIAVFFSFTFLPIFGIVLAYLVLHYWPQRAALSLRPIIAHTLAIFAAVLLMHWLSLAFLNYNFVSRFQSGMTVHHNIDFYLRVGRKIPAAPEPMGVRLTQIARAAWFNNLDLASAVGFPVYILFFAQAVRRIGAFFRGRLSGGDRVVLALLAGFVGINLLGSEQGEVPRLWLFWVPMMALVASCELEPCLRKRPWMFIPLAISQLVTIMLTFHFQDLRM